MLYWESSRRCQFAETQSLAQGLRPSSLLPQAWAAGEQTWLSNDRRPVQRESESLQPLGWSPALMQAAACCHSLERLAGVWLSWKSKTTSLSKGDLSAEGLGYSAGRGLRVSIFDFSKQKCEASKCSDGVLFMGWAIKPTERLTSGLRVCPVKQNILQIIVWSYSTLNEAFHFGSNTVQGEG